jgi:hypothetical protein
LTRRKSRAALIVCAALFYAARAGLFAQSDSLVFRAEKAAVVMPEHIAYKLAIHGADAGEVAFNTPEAQGLVLLTTEKSNAVIDGETAAVICLTFRAEKAGAAMPPPLAVTVKGRQIDALFETVIIKENPAAARPSLRWKIENAGPRIYEGAKVFLTVSVHNAASVESFAWTLDADSMLREISRNEGGQDGVYAARFEWIPLASGVIGLPKFSARVKTFAGASETALLEGVTVRIEHAEHTGAVDSRKLRAEEQAFLNNAFGD